MDEFENQPQQPESPQDANGTSRRNFLKVAVVSSAAAAAAVGGAGVAAVTLSSRAPTGLSKLLVLDSSLVSTKNACATNTDFHDVSPLNKNENCYVWAWFTVPSADAGQSFTVQLSSLTPLPAGATYAGSKQQVAYKNLSGCQDQGTAPSSSAAINSPGADSLPFTFTMPSGTTTVLIGLHLNLTFSSAGSFKITIELTNGSTYDTTATTTVVYA